MIDFNIISAHSIIKELPTSGHSPLLVLGDDFKSYIIKNDKGRVPPLCLLNECFAVFCLVHWSLPVASSTFIQLPKELLENAQLSLCHKSFYYDAPAFASLRIENATDVNEVTLPLNKTTYNQISNPSDFMHISLFDTWVENDDRKPTNYNLIYEPDGKKNKIVPIDHAFIFSSLSYDELNPASYHPIANDHLLVSDLGRVVKKYIGINTIFVEKEKNYFNLCIEKCKNHFDDFSNQMSLVYDLEPKTMAHLKNFIFNEKRNKKVFEEYICRINQK